MMSDTEQYHAQTIDALSQTVEFLEKRIVKLEEKHRIIAQQNEVLMDLFSKQIRGKNE